MSVSFYLQIEYAEPDEGGEQQQENYESDSSYGFEFFCRSHGCVFRAKVGSTQAWGITWVTDRLVLFMENYSPVATQRMAWGSCSL
jgi:hypothetical protein